MDDCGWAQRVVDARRASESVANIRSWQHRSVGALWPAVRCNLYRHVADMAVCCRAVRYKFRVRAASGERSRPVRLRLRGFLRAQT